MDEPTGVCAVPQGHPRPDADDAPSPAEEDHGAPTQGRQPSAKVRAVAGAIGRSGTGVYGAAAGAGRGVSDHPTFREESQRIVEGVRKAGLPARAERSTEQALPQQFPGEFVDVTLVPGSATADGDAEDGDLSSLGAVDDPVALADGTDTAIPPRLADERLALLLRPSRSRSTSKRRLWQVDLRAE
jgi:hypothetical protein